MLPQAVAQDTLMFPGPYSATVLTEGLTVETLSAPLHSGALVVTFSVRRFESTGLLVQPPR